MARKLWACGLSNVIVCRERGTVPRSVFITNSLMALIWSALAIRNNSCRLCWFASWKTLFKNGARRSMRHSMCLEFRQRLMSIYGKNRPTPATQFAMIMLLHVISTPFIQDYFILFVPVKSKCDGFSFFFLSLQLWRARGWCFLTALGERAIANMGSTPPRCNVRRRRRFLGTWRCRRPFGPRTMLRKIVLRD